MVFHQPPDSREILFDITVSKEQNRAFLSAFPLGLLIPRVVPIQCGLAQTGQRMQPDGNITLLDSNAGKSNQHHEASQGHKGGRTLGVVSLHRAADRFLQPRVRCPRQDNRDENKRQSYNGWWNL